MFHKCLATGVPEVCGYRGRILEESTGFYKGSIRAV